MPFYAINSNEKNDFTADDDSEDTPSSDNWFSSPNSSYDRSSISSIPWAEDAINQNKDLWEKIEKIFYREAPLPSDTKTRQEFLEWMNKFPHFRIVGNQIPLHFDGGTIASDADYEEIFSIDPPLKILRKSGDSRVQEINNVRRDRHSNCMTNTGYPNKTKFEIDDLEQEIGKCLRITSGPSVSRGIRSGDDFIKFYKIRGTTKNRASMIPLIKEEDIGRVTSVKSEMYNRSREPYSMKDLQSASTSRHDPNKINRNSVTSAHIPAISTNSTAIKIPPILNLNGFFHQPQGNNNFRGSNATQGKQQISLPSIRLVAPLANNRSIFVRSISAVGNSNNNNNNAKINHQGSSGLLERRKISQKPL